MSVDKVGGPGGVAYGPSSAVNAQTTATVRIGENTVADVAKRLNVDVSALLQANPKTISDPHQKLSVGQELNLPQAQSIASPRDPSTGLPSGKRMHGSISLTTENTPRNFGGDVKLSAAHLPQLQGGVSGSTPAANKSAKFEHSKKFSKVSDEVAWKQDLLKQEPLSKDPTISPGVNQDALPQVQNSASGRPDGTLDAGVHFKYDIKSMKQG